MKMQNAEQRRADVMINGHRLTLGLFMTQGCKKLTSGQAKEAKSGTAFRGIPIF